MQTTSNFILIHAPLASRVAPPKKNHGVRVSTRSMLATANTTESWRNPKQYCRETLRFVRGGELPAGAEV